MLSEISIISIFGYLTVVSSNTNCHSKRCVALVEVTITGLVAISHVTVTYWAYYVNLDVLGRKIVLGASHASVRQTVHLLVLTCNPVLVVTTSDAEMHDHSSPPWHIPYLGFSVVMLLFFWAWRCVMLKGEAAHPQRADMHFQTCPLKLTLVGIWLSRHEQWRER